ncbi:MAG: serine/threonine protein kinase [Dokdonella sp.]
METTMDIDELKAAWQTLDRRLDQQNRINLLQYTEQRVTNAKSRLRPLYWGQLLQLVSGVVMLALGVSVWSSHRDVLSLLLSGLIVHVYGVAMIIFAGITLGMISAINNSTPVVEIQKRLARLRTFYIRGGMAIGLAWWLLWIPFVITFFNWRFGINLYERAPSMVAISVAVGVLGLFATWLFHRWAHSPQRPRLARFLDNSMTGSSLRSAREELDLLNEFERD